MSRLVRLVLLLVLPAAVAVGATTGPAQAGPVPPGPSYGCVSTPMYLNKVNGYVEGKMRLNCATRQISMFVYTVLARRGGGAANADWYSNGKACYEAYICEAVFRVKDVAGTQNYWFTNVNGTQGTRVYRSGDETRHVCDDGYVDCSGINRNY